MLRRRVVSLATGQVRETVHYGITSLSPEQASPDDLLRFIRQHWTIENQLHWVKDVIMEEDHCQLRTERTHHLMALFRNLALSLLRFAGHRRTATSLRFFAARPDEAIQLVLSPIGER